MKKYNNILVYDLEKDITKYVIKLINNNLNVER